MGLVICHTVGVRGGRLKVLALEEKRHLKQ